MLQASLQICTTPTQIAAQSVHPETMQSAADEIKAEQDNRNQNIYF